jgi:RNA recognition motif-containing protein
VPDQKTVFVEQFDITGICTNIRTGKMETKLYVGNMSYDTTEEDLRKMFSEAGTVGSVDVIKDRDTGRPKGFAFITWKIRPAEKAISIFNEKPSMTAPHSQHCPAARTAAGGSRYPAVNLPQPRFEQSLLTSLGSANLQSILCSGG